MKRSPVHVYPSSARRAVAPAASTAGDVSQPADDLGEERGRLRGLGRIAVAGSVILKDRPPREVDARIDAAQLDEASHQQPRADEQHHRQRDLGADQQAPHRDAAAVAPRLPSCSAAAGVERTLCHAGARPKISAVASAVKTMNAEHPSVDAHA